MEYNTSHVDPLHILNVVDVYIHESGHNFSLLHTFGPASTPQLLYKYPDVLSNPDQSDHPYNGDFPRELVIRDPVSGKNFPLPNCYISGDLCCDTEADASYLYPRVFPAFNPSNIMTCIQASTGCVSGWESSDCVFTGEYRDYNEDLITGCFDNYMALGYHETCTPLKFTAEQKDRISWSFNTYWNGWLEESYINVNDKVELRGTSDPMKNVVIRWRHNNPADRYTNSVSNASGDFQGVLFSQTVKAEVHKIGNDKSLAINNSNYYVDKYTYDEWLEDISTYDLLRIQKHILNLQPLADGYRKIAADVNHSNSITTFDIVELRKLILGIYKKLPQFDAPWRFVPEYIPQDNQVQFDYNPFAMSINSQLISGTPYTEPTWEYSIIDGSNGKSGYDGIKIGDAADPNNPVICDNPPSLQFPQVLLSPNETYDIIFKPQRFNDIAAFQLGFFIDHNKLTVIDVSDSNLPEFTQEENVGMTNLEEDQLAILWFKSNTQGHTLANNDTLFKITVEAKQPIIDLGSAINFNNTSLESIFYTEDGCQESVLMDIEVQQGTGIGNRGGVNSGHVSNTSQNLQKQKMICQPNPTSGQVGIYFDSEEITSGTLLVTDMFGKVVYKISLNVERGINVLTLSGNDIESLPTGILTIILQTQNDMRSVRLVKL
ncbi:MAG: T9SS type A sorting domain-containing protein [Lewinellaceae bacterium]|nr:T9SS type A sorting domain-containing protein [Lewinellaceae bacterium]